MIGFYDQRRYMPNDPPNGRGTYDAWRVDALPIRTVAACATPEARDAALRLLRVRA